MARSRRRVLLVAALAASAAACNLIAGLGSFQDVPCAPCDAGFEAMGNDAPPTEDVAPEATLQVDAGSDADAAADADADGSMGMTSTPDASDAEASAPLPDAGPSIDYRWARWMMPNGAEAGLPNPASYTVSDAGVILDNVTHLLWGNAQTNIARFDGGPSTACVYPWRLPTRIELVSILDTSQSSVYVNPLFTTVFPSFGGGPYWTASVYGDAGQPWKVSFNDGTISYRGLGNAVICVQSDGGLP